MKENKLLLCAGVPEKNSDVLVFCAAKIFT